MPISWFRSWHGAPFDSKLAVIAKRANVTRGHAASLWWAVMDFASQNDPRGYITGIDAEEIAAALDYSEDDVCKVLAAMRHKNLLIDEQDKLTGWEKRQVSREDEDAASRKRAQRSRDVTVASRDVTQCHAPDRKTKTRLESKQELPPYPPQGGNAAAEGVSRETEPEQDPAPSPAVEVIATFDRSVAAHFGAENARPWPHPTDLVTAQRWLAGGASIELCRSVFDAVHSRMAAQGQQPPQSLKYHDQPVRQALAGAPLKRGNGADDEQGGKNRVLHGALLESVF